MWITSSQRWLRYLSLIGALLLLSPASGQDAKSEADKAASPGVEKDIPYADGGDQQKLDLYLPAKKDFATVMFTYGGGWHAGSRKSVTPIGEKFQRLGFGCALLSHRLSPKDKFPAHIEDVATAFAWVKRNSADKGGDPKKIFLVGHSSGAHLSLLLATDAKYLAKHKLGPADIAGVVGLSPPVDLEPRENGKGFGDALMGGRGAEAFSRFLVSTSSQNLRYLFRFHHEGTWQQISFTGQGNLSKYGVGSINLAGDVTATVLGNGVIAHGPDGTTQPLIGLLSPAYQAGSITLGGPINSEGQILSQFIIGQSQRLVRLTPTEGCTTGCIQVSSLVVKAKFIEDPNDPDHCTQDGNAYNEASVNLTITSETGTKLRGVVVSGRFLDDYWTNAPVAGRTNRRGVVSFSQTGPCGVGAIAFLVDNAIKGPLAFDRTVGILTGWEIPH